jgi:predicted dehydrogenase
MARRHAAGWTGAPDVEIAAIASRGKKRAEKLAAKFSVPLAADDWESALAAGSFDIVSICIPTAFHPEVAVQALEAGCHVLTEKPIALDEAGAHRMIDAARRSDRLLSVVFNRRFNSVWYEIQRRVGDLGKPLLYNCQEIRSVRPKPAMHDRRLNGGPLVDCIVHDFDMLLSLFGPPRRLYARGRVMGSNKPELAGVEEAALDTGPVIVEFADGHLANILYAWGLPSGSPYWQYREFIGPNGVLRLMGEFGEQMRFHRPDGRLEIIGPFTDDGHEVLTAAFAAAVRGEGPNPVDPAEALDTLRMALAVGESAETGETFEFHDMGKRSRP